jgi:hypothetical protein
MVWLRYVHAGNTRRWQEAAMKLNYLFMQGDLTINLPMD